MSPTPRWLNPLQPELSRREALAPVRRWTPYRKLQLLAAIRDGRVGREEAMAAHGIGAEELHSWAMGLDTFGVGALRARTPLKSLRS